MSLYSVMIAVAATDSLHCWRLMLCRFTATNQALGSRAAVGDCRIGPRSCLGRTTIYAPYPCHRLFVVEGCAAEKSRESATIYAALGFTEYSSFLILTGWCVGLKQSNWHDHRDFALHHGTPGG
jgi:hypothetical protein